MNLDDFQKIYNEVVNSHILYEQRTNWPQKAPFKADAPCYYCRFNRSGPVRHKACDYCIHNPNASLYNGMVLTDD